MSTATAEPATVNPAGTTLPIDIGLEVKKREQLAHELNRCLASTYVLYQKTQTFHWNVQGPLFYSLHKLTEEHYEEMAGAIDVMAERVRALGIPALGGLRRLVEASVLEDVEDPAARAAEMVQQLSEDHMRLATELRSIIPRTEEFDDFATADLLTERIAVHEQASWMLNALLAS